MNNIYKILAKVNSMTEEEIQSIPVETFNFEVICKYGYRSGYLQGINSEKWNCFTKLQINQMSVNSLSYIKEDDLLMLYEKFKNEDQFLHVSKQILDKEIEIHSLPIQYKILNALKIKQAREQQLDKVNKSKEFLDMFEDEEPNALIPLIILKHALDRRSLYYKESLENLFKPLFINPDISETYWKDVQNHIDFKKYKEFIRKQDALKALESTSNIECKLTKFPDILNLETFCNKFKVDTYKRILKSRLWQKIQNNEVQVFQIGKIYYYNYEDLVLELARL